MEKESILQDGSPEPSPKPGSSTVFSIPASRVFEILRSVQSRQATFAELSLTPKAEASSEELRKKLFSMLSSAALARGHKRRASALDVTDYEAAFDDLVNPRVHPAWMDCAADIGLLLGGAFIGAGTNILTGGGDTGKAWIVIIAGAFVGIFCIAIKYIKI